MFYNVSIVILNCNDSETYSNKGLALMALRKHEEAIDCFSKVIELNPINLDAYNCKGCILKD